MPREREAAELLGIPYDTVQQVCLTPVAYTVGTEFRPARREDPETYIHWDRWDPTKPIPAPWAGFANSTRTNGSEDEMTDPQEILNVMSRYCRAVDDRQFDLFAELLAEDVRFEMGDVTESRAELLEYIQANLWPAGRHVYANPVITVDGDTAHVDSDWIWFNPDLVPTRSGRYSDDLRRIDGRWVFTVRRISIAWDRDASGVGETYSTPTAR
jgi:hypothetical protein